MRNFYPKLFYGLLVALLFAGRSMAQDADYKAYQPLIQKNAYRLGITKTDASDAIITNAYTDPSSQLTYVYLQQAYQQVKVYNTIITSVFRNGELLYTSGSFVKNIATKAGSAAPTKTYADAATAAARYLGLQPSGAFSTIANHFATDKKYTVDAAGIAKRPIDVTLFWTASDDKQQVTLTWNVNVDVKDSADWWNVRIDAQTGAYVQKDNWTVSEHVPMAPKGSRNTVVAPLKNVAPSQKQVSIPQILLQAPPPNVTAASYRVITYPSESPNSGGFAIANSPWLLAGATNNATSLGWHFDGTTNYTTTRGNNVFAYLDRANNNTPATLINWPDTSTTAAPSLTFVHNFSTTQQPLVAENQKAILDNLFYWNNLVHDVTYQYGFNEVAGNFQQDNQSRGGNGGDYVFAEAQDAGGTNNANFNTPADGTSGRMQMYLWSPATRMQVNTPETLAGTYEAVESVFSTANKLSATGPITNQVVYYNDNATGTTHLACGVGTSPANSITGKIALIIRGNCNYTEKVKNAQNAGAVAVVMVNNVGGSAVAMGGTDNTITIPAVMISQSNGNLLMAQLNNNVIVNVTLSGSINLDGDLDNGIIVHEYGHGISTRLTGGPPNSGCLNNAEQGGEGWSDYFALMMTTNWATATVGDGPNARPVGTYAAGQFATGSGIRSYPYSTNLAVNPLTYANVATNTEVHAIGEVWCAVLWDLTWALIQQQNSITTNLYNSAGTGGNAIAMNLVITGLKMQPCSPGFLDSRDGILAADSVLYGNAHKCLIWSVFARRGMGFSAIQGSSNNASDQTPAYDIPSNIIIPKPLVRTAGINVPMNIAFTATCNCQPVTGYVIRDTIPAGFTYVSSTPAGTLNGNVLSFSATNFNSLETKNFSLVLRTPATGCTIDSVINDNRESFTAGSLTSSGTPGWSASSAQSYSAPSSWYASEPATITSSSLTSGAAARTAVQNLSILSFWHYYSTEGTYDGGVLEYSTNGGTTWSDATSLFYNNPPTVTMDASTTLSGRKAFSGGTAGFKQSILNLASLGTASVSFRFRMETDDGTGGDGWYVDNIVRANGCGGILKTGTYNSAGVRQDTLMQPIFVTPQVTLPVSLLWFYANAVGSEVALDWKTLSEINAKDFTIEWSTNGTNWSTIGSTAALNRNANSYSFIHTNPASGNNYYRIRMNDADGKFTYSPVRIINMEKGKPMVALVPNPVSTDAILYISPEAKARTVKVYDAAGSLVRQLNVTAGMQQVKISTADLAAGIYTVETNGTSRYTTRMLVQH